LYNSNSSSTKDNLLFLGENLEMVGEDIMGIAEVLTVVFIVLKLTDVISWSWWLVLLPAIISFSIYIIILVVKLIMVIIAVVAVKNRKEV